jgi:acyl-coenzyme A thioesterase PaaI-like protein
MMHTLRMWLWKLRFNLFPAYFGSGARVVFIAPDWREVRVRIPLSWRTRNYVGTTFGGSMYAAVDPIYMMMLIRVLGNGYVVWDKAASIRFRKPGTGTLYAGFRLPAAEIDAIQNELAHAASVDRVYHIDLIDSTGTVHAMIEKTVYVRKAELASTALEAA